MYTRVLLRVTNSARRLALAFATLGVTCGTAFAHFEHKSAWDALWWVVVTASTVGYGDSYPVTAGGRAAGLALIVATVLVVLPLITAHFVSALIRDGSEWTHEEQEEVKRLLREVHESVVHDGRCVIR